MSAGKPKLLLFSHICNPVFVTGGEKVLLLFARELHRRFECVLVVPRNGAIAESARRHGIRTVIMEIPLCISLYIAAPNHQDEIREQQGHPGWRGLHALLEAESPACVLTNTSVHPLPAIAAKSLGIPTIWLLHETIMATPYRRQCAATVIANSDIVVGVSHATLQPLQEQQEPLRAVVMPPYLVTEELQPGDWPHHRLRLRQQYGWERGLVVGFIAATIYTNKGLMQFIQAMLPIAAAHERARFLIVGNPVEEAHYAACRQTVLQSAYADRFVFYPFAEHINQVYPAMDALVVPSLVSEGFGMAALEGMLFGKAVVAFASGGLAEIMASTDNAQFLVPTGDVQGLTERVNALLSDETLLVSVGQRNAEAAQRVYGIEAFRTRLDQLIGIIPPRGARMPMLVRGSGPTVYLLENGEKRPFESPEAMRQRGFRLEDVATVSDAALTRFPSGSPMAETPAAAAAAPGRGRQPKAGSRSRRGMASRRRTASRRRRLPSRRRTVSRRRRRRSGMRPGSAARRRTSRKSRRK